MDEINRRRREESKKPTIAGVLMIIAFLLAVYNAASFFFLDVDIGNIEEQVGEQVSQDLVNNVLNACGVITLIFGFFLLVGGIFAIKKVHWGVALIGSILGIFSIGPMFIGSVLSIAALILLFMAKDEFEGKGKEQQYEQDMTF